MRMPAEESLTWYLLRKGIVCNKDGVITKG